MIYKLTILYKSQPNRQGNAAPGRIFPKAGRAFRPVLAARPAQAGAGLSPEPVEGLRKAFPPCGRVAAGKEPARGDNRRGVRPPGRWGMRWSQRSRASKKTGKKQHGTLDDRMFHAARTPAFRPRRAGEPADGLPSGESGRDDPPTKVVHHREAPGRAGLASDRPIACGGANRTDGGGNAGERAATVSRPVGAASDDG